MGSRTCGILAHFAAVPIHDPPVAAPWGRLATGSRVEGRRLISWQRRTPDGARFSKERGLPAAVRGLTSQKEAHWRYCDAASAHRGRRIFDGESDVRDPRRTLLPRRFSATGGRGSLGLNPAPEPESRIDALPGMMRQLQG